MQRLEALFAGERLERPFVLNGIGGTSPLAPADDPRGWVSGALASLAEAAERSRDAQIFRPLFLEYWYYGVHFVDAVLGATVVPAAVEDAGGWWTVRLTSPVGSLQPLDLARSLPWQQALALAHAMRDSGAALPFFAAQVLASPLNIAVNLYGEEFLLALAQEPHAARRDLRVITDTIKALTHGLRQALPPWQYQPVCVRWALPASRLRADLRVQHAIALGSALSRVHRPAGRGSAGLLSARRHDAPVRHAYPASRHLAQHGRPARSATQRSCRRGFPALFCPTARRPDPLPEPNAYHDGGAGARYQRWGAAGAGNGAGTVMLPLIFSSNCSTAGRVLGITSRSVHGHFLAVTLSANPA